MAVCVAARVRLGLPEAAFVREGIVLAAWAVQGMADLAEGSLGGVAHNQQEHPGTVLDPEVSGYLAAYILVFPPIK